jgi:hypothetical protein
MMRGRLLVFAALGIIAAMVGAEVPEIAGEFINTSLTEDGKPVRLELLIRKPGLPVRQ